MPVACQSSYRNRMTESPFAPWLARTLGEWTSERRYVYFTPNGPVNQIITTHFDLTNPQDNRFTVKWESYPHKDGRPAAKAMTGEMNLILDGHELQRDIGYFTDAETYQAMTFVDEDTVVFRTAYDGQRYREEIRILEDDNLRLRQTVAHEIDTNRLVLAGQYIETRTRS